MKIYDHIKNEDLIKIAINILDTIQERGELRDYLTEQTYNPETQMYDYDYDSECFLTIIQDMQRYLHNNEYKIKENKEKTY